MTEPTTLDFLWAVRDLDDAALGAAGKAVLFALVSFRERLANGAFVIRPSIDQIARGAGISRSTALRAVADLEASGTIGRLRASRRAPCVYLLDRLVRDRGEASTSQRDTTERSHADTTERSQRDTTRTDEQNREWSQSDTRVVSPRHSSGVTVTPSEERILPEGEIAHARDPQTEPTQTESRSATVAPPAPTVDGGRDDPALSSGPRPEQIKASRSPAAVIESDPTGEVRRLPRSELTSRALEFVSVYERAVREETRDPYWPMPRFGQEDLLDFIAARCVNGEWRDIQGWIARHVRAYAKERREGASFHPRFLAEHVSNRATSKPPKKTKYLTDAEATRSVRSPAEQAALEEKYAGWVPPPTLFGRPTIAAPQEIDASKAPGKVAS